MEPARSFDQEKGEIQALEESRSNNSSAIPQTQANAHGDLVGQLVGEQRVDVSEEDVRISLSPLPTIT